MKKQHLVSLFIFLFLILGTVGVILYGRGYRFGLGSQRPFVQDTGLLVATSNPNGAQVKIDGHLTTATNSTINLPPGSYQIEIYKEGYFPWNKRIKIEKEIVSKADAVLYPVAPKLESITSIGVSVPVIDPSNTKIAYIVASQSAHKNGIFILNMNSNSLLTLQSNSTQVVDDTSDKFSTAKFSWSPDGANLLASISANINNSTYYLLDGNNFNQMPADITETLQNVRASWQQEQADIEKARLSGLPKKLRSLISTNFSILAWSADETKILYAASDSAMLHTVINPPIIGSDSSPEARNIQKGDIYVYDIKEDKNFLINSSEKQIGLDYILRWLPDSKHLLYVHDKKIDIMEYDSQNLITVYAGPFIDSYVYAWPDGTKLVILTNLNNPEITPNLYTVSIN